MAAAQTTTSTTISGAQPASSTTSAGTNAPSTLVVQPVKGGNDASTSSGTGGQGSNPSITAGDGGDGAGTGANGGGVGGNLTLATGNGGASIGSAINSSGGNMLLNLGSAGSGGSGAAGTNGTILVSASNNVGNTKGGDFNNPVFCGPTFQAICFFWLYNTTESTYNVLGWRDVISGVNQVCGGLDDQGVRLQDTCAIRFGNGTQLNNGIFSNGGLTTDGMNTGTLSICGAAGANDSCATNDHGGNLTLTHATVSRIFTDNGSGVAAGNFLLSNSWGSMAVATVPRGTDAAFSLKIAEGGTGQLMSPTFTLTFRDLTWGALHVPISTCNLDSSTTDAVVALLVSDTATTLTVTYNGIPANNKIVVFQCHTTGT